MKRKFMPAVLLMLIAMFIPGMAVAQNLYPAYLTMGSGLLLVFALAVYVFRQILMSIRHHKNKPAD